MKEYLLLTLHKQYYRDSYEKGKFTSEISTLGYYDGISITPIKKEGNALENIWCAIEDKNLKLSGIYSNLNIALFREKFVSQGDSFLKKDFPFWMVVFIKLRKLEPHENEMCDNGESSKTKTHDKISDLKNAIESMQVKIDASEYEIASYFTLDNADAVVLIKSNTIHKMFDVLSNLSKAVSYQHSIFGISEQFLKTYEELRNGSNIKKENIFSMEWNQRDYSLEENISNLGIRMVTDEGKNVFSKQIMETYLKENSIAYSKLHFFQSFGHADIGIELENIKVESLMKMMLEDGLLHHKNAYYGKFIYNVETSIGIKDNKKEKDNIIQTKDLKKINTTNFCEEQIETLSNILMKHEYKEKEETLYTYCQALIRTLNSVSQCEQFQMSRELFMLLYPTLKILCEQLCRVLELNDKEKIADMKESLCGYIEGVNSVLYHTINTDQVYLMMPGYSGTSFSIPIKLSIFYMNCIRKIIPVLNDADEKWYECILTPVMGSKPFTGEYTIDKDEKQKIIYVKLGQRMMYFPKYLLIILTHELGHYVGTNIRLRMVRINKLKDSLVDTICEGLIPEYQENMFLINNKELWKIFCEEVKENLRKILDKSITEKCNIYCRDLHSQKVESALLRAVTESMFEDDEGEKLIAEIYRMSPKLLEYAKLGEYAKQMRQIHQMQVFIDANRKKLIGSNTMEYLIQELMNIYREMFSDVAAMEILDCSINDYKKAFKLSEGVDYEQDNSFNRIRKRIIKELYGGNMDCETKEVPFYKHENRIEKYVTKNLFAFSWINDFLKEYASACQKELKERICKNLSEDTLDDLHHIRQIYKKFTEESFYEQYNAIIGAKIEYENYISRELKKNFKNIRLHAPPKHF